MASQIVGETKVLGVIGDPIARSFSPVIHNTVAKRYGHNVVYVPFHVKASRLREAVAGAYALNIKGLNVTMPHKQEIIPLLAGLDETARQADSVNTLQYTENGYIGHNTDYVGLIKCLQMHNVQLKGKNAVVIGAGGGAYAAVMMAAAEGAKHIYVLNRTTQRANKMVSHFKKYFSTLMTVHTFDELSLIEAPDVVIQTTSIGFGQLKDLSPVQDASFFKKVEVALDIIYSPWETKFLQDAKVQGCMAINGLAMLVFQALAAYEIWNGLEIEPDVYDEIHKEYERLYIN